VSDAEIIDSKNNSHVIKLRNEAVIDLQHLNSFRKHPELITHSYDKRLISIVKFNKTYLSLGSGQCSILNQVEQSTTLIGVKCYTSEGNTQIKVFNLRKELDPSVFSLPAESTF
jgi:hypothetical protein